MIGFLFFFLLQAEVERGLTRLYQNVETFSLFVGHSRSGHSLVAAILDSHPEIIISGEFNLLYKLDSFFMDPSETDDEGKLRTFFELHFRSHEQAIFGDRSPNCSSSYCYNIDGSWQGNYKSKLKVIFFRVCFYFPSRCAYFILWIYISTNENWNHGSGGFSMKYRENVTSIQTLYLGDILHNTKSKGNNSLYPR